MTLYSRNGHFYLRRGSLDRRVPACRKARLQYVRVCTLDGTSRLVRCLAQPKPLRESMRARDWLHAPGAQETFTHHRDSTVPTFVQHRHHPPPTTPDPGFCYFDAVANVAGRLPKDWTNANSRRLAAPPPRHGLPLSPNNNITCHRTSGLITSWTTTTTSINDNIGSHTSSRTTLTPQHLIRAVSQHDGQDGLARPHTLIPTAKGRQPGGRVGLLQNPIQPSGTRAPGVPKLEQGARSRAGEGYRGIRESRAPTAREGRGTEL